MATTTNVIELERFEGNSFMGISASSPVVIDFTGKRKNQSVVEFFSDQGTRKTSTLMGILYAMGATFNIEKKKLLNSKDGAIDVNLEFMHDGYKYKVMAKSDRIELKKLNDNGKWTKPEEGSPVELLRKMFGPVGLSPFTVREKKGRQQIEFFREMFGNGEDATKKMQKLENDIDKAFYDRREINKEVKALSAALEIEPLYQNYEKSQKRFEKPINAEKEKAIFNDISKKKADYDRYENNLNILKIEHKSKQEQIEDLKLQLFAAEKEEKEISERITKGNKWAQENKNIIKDFESANKEWLNLSQAIADYEKWKELLKKEKELIEKQDKAIDLTGELDNLREQLLKETKKCLPKAEGLDIKLAIGIDKTDQPEGVFYKGQAIHELSQSEYEAMWAKIFVESGVNFLFFENMNNFGSITIGLLNQLSKEGAIIFGTRTDPTVKEMKVTFKTRVD